MKKSLYLTLTMLLMVTALVSAGPVVIQTEERGGVIIAEQGNSVIVDVNITNTGLPEGYEIYSLAGVTLSPKGSFLLQNGTTFLEVEVFPSKEILKQRGTYAFQYHLKGESSGIFTDTMSIRIVSIEDAFAVEESKLHPNDEEITLSLKNLLNAPLKDVQVHVTSKFFTVDRSISFEPLEEILITLPIDKDKSAQTPPGSYIATYEFKVGSTKTKREAAITYLEKQYISVVRESSGSIIRKTNIVKTNEGNVPAKAEIEVTKSMLTRLVTVNSIEPASTERSGVLVTYTWEKDLAPGESLSISSVTNYTFPFLLLALVIAIAIVVKYNLRTALVISKRVSFVKTKGGEFALKVRLHVKATKEIANVEVKDRIPSGTQLYEKFMTTPQHVDHAQRTLSWHLPHLNRGEERVFSYIIYSKVKMVGRFELPATMATFTHNEKKESIISNRTFFMAETGSTDTQ